MVVTGLVERSSGDGDEGKTSRSMLTMKRGSHGGEDEIRPRYGGVTLMVEEVELLVAAVDGERRRQRLGLGLGIIKII